MEQLAFQIGTEFLDLLPGTQLELEEENPFLQLGEQLLGPYSYPFDVPNTDKNLRLLKFAAILAAEKPASIEDVILWENGIQHSIGSIRIEQINGDINDQLTGTTSLYFLTGSASFWQSIEGKKLGEVDFGGVRTYAQPSTDITSGFWKMVDDAMQGTIDDFDYAFYPVKNAGLKLADGSFSLEYMNRVGVYSGVTRIATTSITTNLQNALYPFPYLIYVMKQVFAATGWKLEGDWLSDPDARKITMLNLKDITWGIKFSIFSLQILPTVSFDLKEYMPDTDVGNFLIQIKNRLGLYYDFNSRTKVCTIRYLKDTIAGEVEDISSICTAPYVNKIDTGGKSYKLVNTFDSGDSLPAPSILGGLEYLGAYLNLPPFAPSIVNVNKVVLVLSQNAYFICRESETTPGTYIWTKYMDNIYDYDPGGTTEEVNTSATTTVMEVVNAGGINGLMPAINQQGSIYHYNDLEPSWGIRLLFFHGMQPDYAGQTYPYASNHPINSQGTVIGNYALSFKFEEPTTHAQIGLYDLFWKAFLDRLKQSETITIDVRYPFSQKAQVKFGSPKVINHTKFFVKKKNSVLPYNGVLKLELIKV